jgi:hypothetical protein
METLMHARFAESLAEQRLMLAAIDSEPVKTTARKDTPCASFVWAASEQRAIF